MIMARKDGEIRNRLGSGEKATIRKQDLQCILRSQKKSHGILAVLYFTRTVLLCRFAGIQHCGSQGIKGRECLVIRNVFWPST